MPSFDLLVFPTYSTGMVLFTLCHTQYRLYSHQYGTEQDDCSNAKRNIGIALSTLHQIRQTYLTKES